MRDLVIAAGLIALAFGIVGAAVFGLGDRDTFVSPPEAVVQEFVRAVGNGRVEPARSMLVSDAERTTSTGEVRAISSKFRSSVGHLNDVEATITRRTRDSASVRADVDGQHANVDLTLLVVREHGAWFVASPSEILTPLQGASLPAGGRR